MAVETRRYAGCGDNRSNSTGPEPIFAAGLGLVREGRGLG